MKLKIFKHLLSLTALALTSLLSSQAMAAMNGSITGAAGDPGTQVTVTLSIVGDTVARGATYHVGYDNTVLTPVVSGVAGTDTNPKFHTSLAPYLGALSIDTGDVSGGNTVRINVGDFTAALVDGSVTLTFDIAGAAPAGTTPLSLLIFESTNAIGGVIDSNVALTGSNVTVNAPAPPTMSVTATDAAASEAGPDTGAFELSCTGGDGVTAVPVAVTFGTGTAADPADYSVAPAFPATIVCPGTAPAVIVTPNVANIAVDGDRTVVATITPDAANFSIGTGSATVTIADDDVPPVLTITATNGEESSAGPTLTDGGFTLTCSAGNVATVNVAFTVSGTATSGTDYTALVASPVAVPCAGAIPVPVVVLADGDNAEFAESVTITLDAVTAGSGYTLGAAAAATSIIVGDLVSATPNVIPTLGTWAFILMTFALMFIAVPMVRRRQS